MKFYTNNKLKKTKKWIITGSVLGVIALFLLTINLIPPVKVMEDNPFLVEEGELPMLCAHRGGKVSNPENTLKAYKNSLRDYDIDIMETDLWLTKDNHLVLNHDSTINRTSDVEEFTGSKEDYLISDHTLDELKNFNFGYNFNINGEYPYRDLVTFDQENRKEVIEENDLSIITIEDLLGTFYEDNKDLLFIVEIKDSGERGFLAADILENILRENFPDYLNRIVIGTFHTEVENYLKTEHPSLLRGASTGAVIKYCVMNWTATNLFNYDNYVCLQLPTSQMGIDLTWDYHISEAHQKNIAVQYWTINDEATMRTLIEKGCDAIMTDDPALLKSVLDSYK